MQTPTPRFLSLLTAVTLLLLGSGLRADTVVTDPKGKTLQLGRSEVSVDFTATNFDPDLQKVGPHGSLCIIMGMIDGRVVAASLLQTNPALKNKLFYVTLLGGGKASFSGLIEDRIQVTGATPLSRYVKHEDPMITVTDMHNDGYNFYNPYSRGQLLQWTGINRDGTPARHIFMIDGYQKEIDVFTLKDSTVQGEPIGVQELAFSRKLLLPGKYGVEGYEINALDCIDLNAFRDTSTAATNAPTEPLPKALMVWCKPQGKTGYKDIQLVLPTDVLTCSVNDALTDIQINAVESRPFDPFNEAKNSDDIDNVIGGCVTAPDEKGNLCYWFSDLRVEHHGYSGDFYVRINKKVISNLSGAGYLTTKPSTRTSEYYYYFNGEWAKQYMWDEMALNNPGLKVVIATNAPQSVSIVAGISRESYGVLQRSNAQKIAGNEFIGICDPVPQSEVDQINATTRIIGGAVPSDLTERLKRVAVVEGFTVLRVFLGQPYLAAPSNDNPTFNPGKIFKNCSYKYKYQKSSLYQNSFNNGTSSKLEMGISAKDKWGLAKAEFGVQSSYEYDFNKDTNSEITIGANIQEVASTADSFELGSIVYTKIQPKISTMARVVPSKENKKLTVLGDTNAYQFLMINTSPQQGTGLGPAIFIQRFSITNPALVMEGMNGQPGKEYYDAADHSTNKTTFETTYSVLSDGLLARPFSSLISCTNTNGISSLPTVVMNAHKNIIGWESSNNLIADLQQFNSKDGGVSAYFGTVQNGTMTPTGDGSVDLGYNLSANYSIVNETETKVTRAHKWSTGFYWSTAALLFATKGEVNYKGGVKEVNTDSDKNQFEIGIGGWDQAPNITRSYYYYWIDVPSIKSYMASHAYTLLAGENKGSYTNEVHRPAFIPAYCWLHNQSFMLGVPWIKPWVNSAQSTR